MLQRQSLSSFVLGAFLMAGAAIGEEGATGAGDADVESDDTQTFEEAAKSLEQVNEDLKAIAKGEKPKPRGPVFSAEDPQIGRYLRPADKDGAETPRALVERVCSGFRKGDGDVVAGCFDRKTEDGRIAAAGFAVAAGLHRSAIHWQEEARKKFGEAGAEAVEEHMADTREVTLPEAAVMSRVEAATWPIFGDESQGWVVVRLPVRQVRVPSVLAPLESWPASRKIELRGGRWYLVEPTLWEVTDYGKDLIQREIRLWIERQELYDERSEMVERYKTLAEFRQALLLDERPADEVESSDADPGF